MGERLLHIEHSRSANPTSSGGSTAKKDAIVAICFVALLCRTGANFLCKPEQILLTNIRKIGYQCLDCPTCPPGSQPSVPCGSTIKNWTAIHCVPCQLGKTFSDNYDKAQCAACSVCSMGRVVLKNCTRLSNSKCSRCRKGYYYKPFSFACKPCAKCCGDRNDEFAKECERYDHKCKVPSTPCSHTQTTLMEITAPTGIVPTTQKMYPTDIYKKPTTEHKEERGLPFDELKSSLKPTQADDKALDNVQVSEDATGPEISFVIILFAVVAAFCVAVLVLIILKKSIRLRNTLRRQREVDRRDSVNSSSHEGTRALSNRPQSGGSVSSPLDPAALSKNNPSAPHQQNGSAPKVVIESTLPLSSEPASQPRHGSESSLPNCSERHHAPQSKSLQSEATQLSGSASSLHASTGSSEKTGSSPPVNPSKEASHLNSSNSSQPSEAASSLTNACQSTQLRESESSKLGHRDSLHSNPHTILSSPTQLSSQCSRSASPQPTDSCLPVQAEYTSTTELDENYVEAFDWMCAKLDDKRSGMRYDFEKLASFCKISLAARDSLKHEFQSGNSPSYALMGHIKAKHPNLLIHKLIEDLEIIGRIDIAEGLKLCIFRSDDSPPTQVRSPRVNC